MVRAPVIDKNGLRKGAWSLEEDDRLRAYIEKNGPQRWRQVPRLAGLTRCGKSCRLRWLNYLRPDVKRGNYTKEENELICKMHEKYGNKWSAIAAKLPGRTDNEIKNHWHTHLKKQVRQKPSLQAKPEKQLGPMNYQLQANQNLISETESFCAYSSSDFGILESSSVSRETSSCSDNSAFGVNWIVEDHSSYGDFWTEPFISDYGYVGTGNVMDNSLPMAAADGIMSPHDLITCDDYIDLFCYSS